MCKIKTILLGLIASLIMPAAFISCEPDNIDPDADDKEQTDPHHNDPVTDPDIPDEPQQAAIELDRYLDGLYFGDFWKEGFADYYFMATDAAEIGHLANGTVVPMEVGRYVFYCDLWGAIAEDHTAAVLPEGVYTAHKGRANNTFNLELTLATTVTEKVGDKFRVKDVLFKDGKVTVKHVGSGYEVLAEMVTVEDEKITFRYTGEMKFSDQSNDEKKDNHIRENLTPDFRHTTKQLFSDSSEESDNYLLRCFTSKKITDDGLYTYGEGLKLQLDLNTPKGQIEGIYKPAPKDSKAAGTFLPGLWFGQQALGTFCMKTDADLKVKFCIITDGSVEIRRINGEKYSIRCDLVDSDGYKITAEWETEVEEFEVKKQVQTTLTHDIEVTPTQCTELMYFGDYYQNGTVNYNMVIANETEMIALDFIAESGDAQNLPVGEFIVRASQDAQTVLPGDVGLKEANPTCYLSYAKSDGDLVLKDKAPVMGGTMKISRNGDEYTVEFNFLDDFNRENPSLKANIIKGKFTGKLPAMEDYTQSSATKANVLRQKMAR